MIDGGLQSNPSDPFRVGPLDAMEGVSLSPDALAQVCKIHQILLENGEERSGYGILSPAFQDLGFVKAKAIVSVRQNTVGVGRVCTKNTIDVSVSQKQNSSAWTANHWIINSSQLTARNSGIVVFQPQL